MGSLRYPKIDNEHFSDKELSCRGENCCNGTMAMDRNFMDVINTLRWKVGPIYVNSAFRCRTHNLDIGGAVSSFHTLGLAMDIRAMVPLDTLANEARALGLFVIEYDNFIHVDGRYL
jgi:uncharacterized protein YcbK (DUF882 family)